MGKRTMRRSTATEIEPEVRKPERVVRSVDENKERAYIAASRRSDRSIEDRMQSAHKASEIHKARTGKRLKITREAVEKELMFEEEDDAPRSASHLYHNSLGISMAHQEEVNREFEQTFGHLARHYSFSYRPTFAPQPWANPQADSALQQQEYATGYHPQTMTAMPQYAQPVLDMTLRAASQPLPISPIELIQPYRPPVTLPLRELTTEDSQSPAVVTPGQATISPISNTPSHPYNSASPPELATGSNSPSSMSDTDRPLKRKSIAVDSDSPPSYRGTGRPIKRRSISSDERIPSLTHSPDPAGDSDPDQPVSPIKKEDDANIDPLLTDWTRVNPPSTCLVPQTNYLALFDFGTLGGEGGAAEYPELVDITEAVKITFDFPFGGTASFSPTDVSDLAYDPNAWDDLIYVDGPPAAPS